MRDAEIHRLIGGAPCLDFTNTLNGHRGQPKHEYLLDYRDLLLWSRHAGMLTEAQAAPLLVLAEREPSRAQAALEAAINLREALFRVFSSLAGGAAPPQADLELLNAFRQEALRHSQIVPAGKSFTLAWTQPPSLEQPLWSVILSAVQVLTSEDVHRLRECHGDGCDWLFIDASRNHQRRWCTMDECGNRSKMRRRYARKRQINSPPSTLRAQSST